MLSEFKKIYSLSKTLRFELKPVAETVDHLENFKSVYLQKVVEEDQQLADRYQKIKKQIIDKYHQEYIEEKLDSPADPETGEHYVNADDFEAAFKVYQELGKGSGDKTPSENKEKWEKQQESLREKLIKCFSDKDKLFKKEFIKETLPEWLKRKGEWEEQQEIVESFDKFTTYFTGFNENRKNMYSSKAQSTAIANRLMNENLPSFFENCIAYKKITKEYPDLEFSIEPGILEKLGVDKVSEVFKPAFFINLFTQSGIDAFQELLGGTEQDGTKHQGLNEHINLYGQKHSIKSKDLPRLMSLYKQILSKRETTSFVPESFGDDKDLLESLREFIKRAEGEDGLIKTLTSSLKKLKDADPARTYIKTAGLSEISTAMFGDWGIIRNALERHAETIHPASKNGKITKKIEEQRKHYSEQNVFSLKELDEVLTGYVRELDDPEQQKIITGLDKKQPVLRWIVNALENAKKADADKDKSGLYESIENVKKLLHLDALSKNRKPPRADDKTDTGGLGYQQVQTIHEMLEAFMTLLHSVKPLHLVEKRKPIDMPDIDMSFYSDFSVSYENYEEPLVTLYNKARNHLTKKPFSKDKIKINFEKSTLLAGWDVNKETANLSVLFEKNGQYFLGIMHPKHGNLFNYSDNTDDAGNKKCLERRELKKDIIDTNKSGYRKIVYKSLSDAYKNLPRVFFSATRKALFSPSNEINRIRNTASHSKKGKPRKGYEKTDFNLDDCHTMIDFFKESIEKHPEWHLFGFKFSETSKYKDLSGFYREFENQAYKIDFHYIRESYIDDCIKQEKLFLFQIYNKDFSTYSKGKPNLHTLYWKGLFEQENLKDVVLKLNGKAEIFYRKHSIERKDTIVHDANKPIKNKNNPAKKESAFEYKIVKDKRYTQDKFLFHVPVTLNFKEPKTPKALEAFVSLFNDRVNHALRKKEETHIIGIDRGERHLLYYTVIDRQGNIIEQGTLNEIETDKGYNIDYQKKLHSKEKERDRARKSWSSIENIKELKTGYLSHVIHKLAKLIIKHNAIVCLEDLNFGFKRGRFKVEKQVYQKFEKALIDKLNYLIFKETEMGQPGHYLNAYQLTAPFVSFERLGKQSGILYYVQAAYTSKIDPATGFMNFLHTRYENLEKSKQFFEAMASIKYNQKSDYFEFEFDYSKYPIKQVLGEYQKEWTACTHGDTRYGYNKKEKKTETVNVTEKLKTLLDDKKIDYKQGEDIKDDIATTKDTKFYKKLYWLLHLTLWLRHTNNDTGEDFILSPIKDKNGKFFDSRKATEKQPKDADANGAYHIALKGIWVLNKIDAWDGGEKSLKLAMKNEDWFDFVQDRVNRKTNP